MRRVGLLLLLGASACTGRPGEEPAAQRPWAPPFHCDGDRCVRIHPRMPDDGEWACTEEAGVVVCRHLADAAGVVPGPPDPGWHCSEGRPRVCVDPAPDRPGPGVWRCAFHLGEVWERRCERDPDAKVMGRPCQDAQVCPPDAVCRAGRCQPAFRIVPQCYQDEMCEGGRCRYGTCRPSPP